VVCEHERVSRRKGRHREFVKEDNTPGVLIHRMKSCGRVFNLVAANQLASYQQSATCAVRELGGL
jgi:hypothetical protein